MQAFRFFAFLSVAVGGCSIHPLPDDFPRETTVAIVKHIRCEAREAINKYAPGNKFDSAAIAYEFQFTITEDNDNSGSASLTLPFANGKFTLAVGGGETKQRIGDRNFVIAETFRELRQENCAYRATRENWRYPITGIVGLDESVSTFMRLASMNLLEKGKEGHGSFVDSLEYTTKLSGNVDPKVELNPVSNKFRLVDANASLSASREDKHQLKLSLSIPTAPTRGSSTTTSTERALEGLNRYNSKFLRIDRGTVIQTR